MADDRKLTAEKLTAFPSQCTPEPMSIEEDEVHDEYVAAALKEIQETVPQFAGIDGPALAASLASLMVAFVKEVFERLATVERALAIVDVTTPTRQVSLSEDAAPNLALVPSPTTDYIDPLVQRPVPAPAPAVSQRLDQIRQLEMMVEQLKRGQSIAAQGVSATVSQWEVRHVDGSLARQVPDHIRVHSTREAAEQARQMVEATNPGWQGRLLVEEVQR